MKSHMLGVFHGTRDYKLFIQHLQGLVDHVPPVGVFAGDNLFTYGRNLGFLDDEKFMATFNEHAQDVVERSTAWRLHILCWAARRALKLDGDFVECACYKGTSARIVADYVDLEASGKSFYLYDLFDHDPAMPHHRMPEHGATLFETVKSRFAEFSRVHVTQGRVPDVLHEVAPDRISFLHLDLNNAVAEVGALEFMFERVSPGAPIVLDDYGWHAYRAQKAAIDAFLGPRNYQVLELPTGQGLLIK